jgi:hypothetical protein
VLLDQSVGRAIYVESRGHQMLSQG